VRLVGLGVAGVVCVLLDAAAAEAATPATAITLTGCADLSENALREHLELELATLALSQADAELELRCDGSAVIIALRRASGVRYPVEVRVELRDTAKTARERLVALAASELIAQAERARPSDAPARPSEVPSEEPKTLANSPENASGSRVARRAGRPPVELFVAGSAASSGSPRALLWGGSLGTRWGLSRRWSVLVDTRFERGEERLPLASVRFSLLSGFVGAGVDAQAGPLGFSAGLGVRAGWLSLAATATAPNEGLSLTAPWAGIGVPLRLALDLGGSVAPFLGGEVGAIVLPVRGKVSGGGVLVEEQGIWLSGGVGLAITL
jgi:hypothetical protein